MSKQIYFKKHIKYETIWHEIKFLNLNVENLIEMLEKIPKGSYYDNLQEDFTTLIFVEKNHEEVKLKGD